MSEDWVKSFHPVPKCTPTRWFKVTFWSLSCLETHPGKLTCQWKIDRLKMYLLLKRMIFHCHVRLLVFVFSGGSPFLPTLPFRGFLSCLVVVSFHGLFYFPRCLNSESRWKMMTSVIFVGVNSWTSKKMSFVFQSWFVIAYRILYPLVNERGNGKMDLDWRCIP